MPAYRPKNLMSKRLAHSVLNYKPTNAKTNASRPVADIERDDGLTQLTYRIQQNPLYDGPVQPIGSRANPIELESSASRPPTERASILRDTPEHHDDEVEESVKDSWSKVEPASAPPPAIQKQMANWLKRPPLRAPISEWLEYIRGCYRLAGQPISPTTKLLDPHMNEIEYAEQIRDKAIAKRALRGEPVLVPTGHPQ